LLLLNLIITNSFEKGKNKSQFNAECGMMNAELMVYDQRFPKFLIGLERRQILTVRQFFLFAFSATGSARKRTSLRSDNKIIQSEQRDPIIPNSEFRIPNLNCDLRAQAPDKSQFICKI
jgi:hypothetical protein